MSAGASSGNERECRLSCGGLWVEENISQKTRCADRPYVRKLNFNISLSDSARERGMEGVGGGGWGGGG